MGDYKDLRGLHLAGRWYQAPSGLHVPGQQPSGGMPPRLRDRIQAVTSLVGAIATVLALLIAYFALRAQQAAIDSEERAREQIAAAEDLARASLVTYWKSDDQVMHVQNASLSPITLYAFSWMRLPKPDPCPSGSSCGVAAARLLCGSRLHSSAAMCDPLG